MNEDILMIAALSRQACEQYNNTYAQYPPHLNGLCGLASHFLFNNLRKAGYDPRFVITTMAGYGSHCWVSLGRDNIDITATQFSTCSPIFNFKGAPEKHPVLCEVYHNWRQFPNQWEFQKTDNHKDIAIIMKNWRLEESYRGLTRKRLDSFYKIN